MRRFVFYAVILLAGIGLIFLVTKEFKNKIHPQAQQLSADFEKYLAKWQHVQAVTDRTHQRIEVQGQNEVKNKLGSLIVPQGAISKTTEIDVQINITKFNTDSSAAAIVVECGPDGLTFDKPVLAKVQLPVSLPRGALLPLVGNQSASVNVSPDDEPIIAMVSYGGNELCFAIRHFSSYTITWGAIRNAIDSWNARGDFMDVRLGSQSEPHFVAFYDFKPSAILNGDPVFTFKGMSDASSRRESFKYALRQAILQDRLPITPTDQSAQAMLDNSQAFFDMLDKESKAVDVARTALKLKTIRLSASYQKVLETYAKELSKGEVDITLRGAHTRLLNRLKDISDKAGLASAAGSVAINIGKDVYTALFIQSLSEEVVDAREATLRSALSGNKAVPQEVTQWLEEAIAEIDRERADLWTNIGKRLQEGAVQDTVLPLVDLVNTVGPFLSAGWDKVASKFAIPIGAAIETAKTLAKVDDFGWMIGKTTAVATLVYSYLPSAPSEATGVTPPEKALAPEMLQIRAYLLYFCYDAYAQAYEGELIDHGVRWLIGSLQGLAGTVPSWREDRLACLKSQKEFFADKYTSATNLIGIHFGSVDAGTAQLQPTVTSSSLLEELEFDFAKANRYLIRNPIIFSNDGYHVAFVMSSEDNKKKVFVDGKSVPVAYDDISKETPIFSQDGHHIAYEAKKDNKWLVVRDSQEGQNYDSIDSLTFSPDGNRIAYKARKINGYIKIFYSKTPVPNYLHFVVIDNQEGPKYHRIEDLRFSPDGKHLAYVAYRDYDHSIIVVDGEEKGSWYDDILYYIFSPDGKRIAYYARKDNNMLLVVDGQESQKYFYDTSILEDCKFNFSPDSKHLAYIANRDLFHSVLIVDGQEKGLEYDSVYDFTFSSDGKRMAYAGRKGAENHVVVDGHEGPRYDGVKICNIKFSPDGKRVTYSLDTIADRVFVVVDDQKGQEYRWVDAPIFSPDGKRMAYAAQTRKGAEDIVVVDGQEGAVYEHINFHGFSPNGKLLYRAQKNKKGFLVVDGHEGHEYDHINPPIFSRDGKHIAYEASNGKKWYVNLDNYEVAECMGRGIKFRSDGRLAYLCRKDDHVSVKYLLPAER